jgi:uncharacterized RDD family membrane protein YckC
VARDEPKTLNSEAQPGTPQGLPLTFERVAGACAVAVAAIFLFQELVLRLSPGPSTADEWLAAPLASVEKLRMALMFVLFFLSLVAYAGVSFRAGNEASRVALVFAAIGCAVELGYRAVEMQALPQWAEGYRLAEDTAVRAIFRSRVESFLDVTSSLYSVIRGTAILTSVCFGIALLPAKGLQRTVALLFTANAARLALNYPRPFVPALAPILDWVFILVLAPLYVCIGVWLWSPTEPVVVLTRKSS